MDMKTVNRGWLRKQVEKGNIEAKCAYSLSDDYGFDKSINYGKTDWSNAKELNFSDWDFKTKSGAAWYNTDGTITFIVHSNSSYDMRIIEKSA
jgi:hypothetical protein